jgi:hypothetical protein
MNDIILIANRPDDGTVEYYGWHTVWTPCINSAWVFPSIKNAKNTVGELLTHEKIYSIPVEKVNGQIIPVIGMHCRQFI